AAAHGLGGTELVDGAGCGGRHAEGVGAAAVGGGGPGSQVDHVVHGPADLQVTAVEGAVVHDRVRGRGGPGRRVRGPGAEEGEELVADFLVEQGRGDDL